MRGFRAASIGVIGVLLAAGCAERRYVNRTLYGPTGKPQVHDDPMIVPVVPDGAHTDVALGATPPGVQSSFHNEYPAAAITNVEQVPTGAGQMLYRVTYIDGGQPGQVTYHGNGVSMAGSDGYVVVGHPDGLGRPGSRPTTGPAKEPF